jgi:hypothetical protein
MERASVTVKGMSRETWDRARAGCQRNDEPMHEWLGRAISQLADREEAAPRIVPPGRPEAPQTPPLDAAGLQALKTAARHAFALLSAELRRARGLPPLAPRRRRLLIDA